MDRNKKFLKITESLNGFLATNRNVGLLEFGKVAVRKDYASCRLPVISGGQSVRAPAFTDYAGQGLLTAALAGEQFEPPHANDILRTLKEIHRSYGVLIIIGNDVDDLIAFSLAMEKANNFGICTKLVTCSDSICDTPCAGVVLLQKIAAAKSEREPNAQIVYNFCQKVLENMASVPFRISTLSQGGEGFELIVGDREDNCLYVNNVQDICKLVFDIVTAVDCPRRLNLVAGSSVILLLNCVSDEIEMPLAEAFFHLFHRKNIIPERIYCGCFSPRGFSVTILSGIDATLLSYLDAPCFASVWSKCKQFSLDSFLKPEKPIVCKPEMKRKYQQGVQLSPATSRVVQTVLEFTTNALMSCEKQLNVIDEYNGFGGELGTRVKALMTNVDVRITQTNENVFACPFHLFGLISESASESNSDKFGSLIGIVFEAAANCCLNPGFEWRHCLLKSSEALKRCSQGDVRFHQMHMPLANCAHAIANETSLEAFSKGVTAAEETALKTRPTLKRHPSCDTHFVAICLRAIYEGIKQGICTADNKSNNI